MKPTRSETTSDYSVATTRRESTILSVSNWGRMGKYLFAGAVTIVSATATALNLGLVNQLEQQLQVLHFELRGPVPAPDDIVILAIDETSLRQQEFYQQDPKQYAYLEPLQSWPWQRSAYAIATEKILNAGARAIAINIIFATPSSYGPADDERLTNTLEEYPGQIVLSAQYIQQESDRSFSLQLTSPIEPFEDTGTRIGSINFYLEPDGRVHRLGEEFINQVLRYASPQQTSLYRQLESTTPTLAEATLKAAREGFQPSSGNTIYFYGPSQTFTHIPFWHVLEPDNWNSYLQGGDFFEDKIVLIGSTAETHQDFHATPFGESLFYPDPMSGVELHANAIASLMYGKTISPVIPQAPVQGVFLLLSVGTAAWVILRMRQPLSSFGVAITIAIAWWIISYILFTHRQLILPTTVPMGAIATIGTGQLLIGTASEQIRKRQLRDTLKQYSTSPIVQQIISQQDDLKDLLREREQELSGKLLAGRYKITKVLGSGGFSETYIAQDMQRPGLPDCVVKKLQVRTDNPKTIDLARRLFLTEAETLEKLGQHDQIPQLMAFFEEAGEFYLIQEFIMGRSLADEFRLRTGFPVFYVLWLLKDLLNVLEFVHSQDVIHRDLKPSNIIRRQSDSRLVLIDFGVAKKISTQLADVNSQTKFTVAVGTPGYMPSEQSAGRPRFNSDLYALGIMAIEALTGQAPRHFTHDPDTGNILWHHRVGRVGEVDPRLIRVIDRLAHHDFTQRYQSAQQVQQAIAVVPDAMEDITTRDLTAADPNLAGEQEGRSRQLEQLLSGQSPRSLNEKDLEQMQDAMTKTVSITDGDDLTDEQAATLLVQNTDSRDEASPAEDITDLDALQSERPDTNSESNIDTEQFD